MAVPVRDPDGRLIAALGISVPTRRFQNQLPTLARVLRDVGLAASQEIGRLIGDFMPEALGIPAPARGGSR
jgi:DNA-binding IclR family transcriptional regulator